jgi:hypothetical protein
MKLEQVSSADLLAELERRAVASRKPPKQLAVHDWTKLTRYVTSSVEELAKPGGYVPKDFEHWVFESVIETIYGKPFWLWWNNGPADRADR